MLTPLRITTVVFALPLVACAGASGPRSAVGAVTMAKDRFSTKGPLARLDGMAVVTPDVLAGTKQLDFWAEGGGPRGALVMIHSVSDHEPSFQKCHHLTWLIDGKPVPVPQTQYEGSPGSGFVSEWVTFNMYPDDLQRLASAKAVEGKLCYHEFAFNEAQLAVWRDFYAKVKATIDAPASEGR